MAEFFKLQCVFTTPILKIQTALVCRYISMCKYLLRNMTYKT